MLRVKRLIVLLTIILVEFHRKNKNQNDKFDDESRYINVICTCGENMCFGQSSKA